MSEPVLVLNCGSSSIKFALFDPGVDPLPRTPMWSGRLEGIGSSSARLVEGGTPPVAVALDAEQPYASALQLVRACVEQRTRGHLPAARSRCSRPRPRMRGRAALELYVRRVVREIGARAATLGGLGMLAFTAGVGEHSPVLRERICGALEWLGLQLDDAANRADAATSRTRAAACALSSSRPTRSGSWPRMR